LASIVSIERVVKGYVRGKQRVEVLHGLAVLTAARNVELPGSVVGASGTAA
jgi:hypothetical protein